MNNIRTVSDTKRTFYSIHTRPVNSIYRRVVEELMVEMHLLSVNVNFRYDPIYALGVVTVFDRFLQSYSPETDKASIFHALVQAQGDDPQKYRADAKRLEAVATRLSPVELIDWLSRISNFPETGDLQDTLNGIAQNPQFKYSRLFGIGLLSLLEMANPSLLQDEQQRNEALPKICTPLNLSFDKLTKDLDLYRSNLDKVAQAKLAIEDTLKADRKKREQQAAAAQSAQSS